jgi:hypothetical protein
MELMYGVNGAGHRGMGQEQHAGQSGDPDAPESETVGHMMGFWDLQRTGRVLQVENKSVKTLYAWPSTCFTAQ